MIGPAAGISRSPTSPSDRGAGDGSVVGIDGGVVVAAALSTGELLHAPGLARGEAKRLKVLQQRLARAKRGSSRRVANETGDRETEGP